MHAISESRSIQDKISGFLDWLDSSGFQVSPKLAIRNIGELYNLGVFANSPITKNELLFIVPRQMILSSFTCSISSFLNKHSDELKSHSGWLPQILAVMYERVMELSKWRPYFQVSPNFGAHQLPLLWTPNERQRLLRGTGLVEKVNEDLKIMEEEWKETLIPFVNKYTEVFAASEFRSLKFFKDIVAFILAYSFSEPEDNNDEDEDSVEGEEISSLPYMVPMADILNHSPRNNAEVQYKTARLEIRAICEIGAGEEIFNTYGDLSNWELLHCYGFALPHQVFEEAGCDSVPICLRPDVDDARWKRLCLASLVSEGASTNFAFDGKGFVNPESAAILLSVVLMSDEEFKQRTEDNDVADSEWISCLADELENEVEHLMHRSHFHRMSSKWTKLICKAAERQLQQLPQEKELRNLKSSVKETFSNFVCLSQKRLLQELLQSLHLNKNEGFCQEVRE